MSNALYIEGGASYGAIKKELVEILWEMFRSQRLEKKKLMADPGHIRSILADGARKAREIAFPTIEDVRKKVGIKY